MTEILSEQSQRTIQAKFVTLYDTAKKCLIILDRLFADLEDGAKIISESNSNHIDTSIIIGIHISALGLIDYFQRFDQLIQAMPLLSKKDQNVKKLSELMDSVKKARNYLQHMRGDLNKSDHILYPILGSISWISDNRNYTIAATQATNQCQMLGIVYDSYDNKYICQYQLSIGGYEVHLDTVYHGTKSFWEWLNDLVKIEPSEIKNYDWGSPHVYCSSFEVVNKLA